MKIIIILLLLCVIYAIWQREELKKFEVTHYRIASDKIERPLRLLLVSDFHCHEYGAGNERLAAAVREAKPDLILVPGDMIVTAHTQEYPIAAAFLKELALTAPVYLANGNHESRAARPDSEYLEEYLAYQKQLEELGVQLLNNKDTTVSCNGNRLHIYGVEIPLECYTKGKTVPLPKHYMEETLGRREDEEAYTILLAHNPIYCEEYAAWGADLIVSGHMHGGLVRIPHVGSIISPQFKLFPSYDAGEFTIGRSHAVVSRGLGTHTFHIRVFNRAELAVIELEPLQSVE